MRIVRFWSPLQLISPPPFVDNLGFDMFAEPFAQKRPHHIIPWKRRTRPCTPRPPVRFLCVEADSLGLTVHRKVQIAERAWRLRRSNVLQHPSIQLLQVAQQRALAVHTSLCVCEEHLSQTSAHVRMWTTGIRFFAATSALHTRSSKASGSFSMNVCLVSLRL